MKRTTLLTVLLASILMVACTGKKSQKPEDPAIEKETIKESVEKFVYPIPSSFELAKFLNEIEANYIIGITTPATNYEKYLTDNEKALALGIYTADLSYTSIYNNKQATKSYLENIKLLVQDLGITAAISPDLTDVVEEKFDNKDDITEILTTSIHNTYNYMNMKGRAELSYLIIAGTWIEGMFLTTNVSENNYDNAKLVETILYQIEPLVKVTDLMEQYKDTETSSNVYNKLMQFRAIFAEQGNTAISRKQYKELIALTAQVRTELIK